MDNEGLVKNEFDDDDEKLFKHEDGAIFVDLVDYSNETLRCAVFFTELGERGNYSHDSMCQAVATMVQEYSASYSLPSCQLCSKLRSLRQNDTYLGYHNKYVFILHQL